MTPDPAVPNPAAPAAATPGPRWTQRGEPAFRRINAALFLAGLATFSLLYCVQPLLPTLTEVFGISAAASALALSLTTGCLAVSIVVAGSLSDRWGRKAVMVVSLFTGAALNSLVAVAPGWSTLLALRTLEGIALGGAPAVAMAYLAEEIHPRSLGFAMGLYVGGTAIGGMSGRLVVAVVADHLGWRAAVGAIGLLGLAAALGFVLLLPSSRNFASRAPAGLLSQIRGYGRLLRHPALPLLFAAGGLQCGTFVALYNFLGFRLQAPPFGLSQAQSGAVFSLYAFGTLASTVAGAAADRLGRPPVQAASAALLATGLLLTLASSLAVIVAGIAVLTLGFFAGHAVASGWVGRLAGPAKGKAASLYLLSYYLGASLFGSIGGVFWSRGGWPAVVTFLAAVVTVLAAVVALLWWRTDAGLDRRA